MSSKVQLTGGAFQDAEGNVLANGYLEFVLNQDSSVTGSGNIAAGVTIRIQLDSDGNAASTASTPPATNQFIWGNDILLPINSYYRVTGYTTAGQPAWGPNNQQVIGNGTFDLGTWVPNQVFSWTPPTTGILLETDDTPNVVQTILDLESGNNITLTDNGDGSVTIDAAQGGFNLKINGVQKAPTPHSTINFVNGNGITLTDDGSGNITIGEGVLATGGFFFGAGVTDLNAILASGNWSTIGAGIAGGVVAANVVTVYMFETFAPFTISKVTTRCSDNIAAHTATFGIYSLTGNKLIDGGSFATLTGSGASTNSITPTILPPGVYWHAQATDSASNPHFYGLAITSSGTANEIVQMLYKNTVRAATAANPLSSGVLPATLGALTPFLPTSGNSDGICSPLYE